MVVGREKRREFYIIKVSDHLSRLASLSHSIRARMSPILTGPFTFLRICLDWLSLNWHFTWVMPPLEPSLLSGALTSSANDFGDGDESNSGIHLWVGLSASAFLYNNKN